MRLPSRTVWFLALTLAVALAFPLAASAATIYVNVGVNGAKLGMKDTKAAKKLGKVKKKVLDPSYDTPIWVRSFGKKVHGQYALELYSNGKHKVTAFAIYSAVYKVKGNKIHVGSTVAALQKAYKNLQPGYEGGYSLRATHSRTDFWIDKGKIVEISIRSI
jgi:hypothetical protein